MDKLVLRIRGIYRPNFPESVPKTKWKLATFVLVEVAFNRLDGCNKFCSESDLCVKDQNFFDKHVDRL